MQAPGEAIPIRVMGFATWSQSGSWSHLRSRVQAVAYRRHARADSTGPTRLVDDHPAATSCRTLLDSTARSPGQRGGSGIRSSLEEQFGRRSMRTPGVNPLTADRGGSKGRPSHAKGTGGCSRRGKPSAPAWPGNPRLQCWRFQPADPSLKPIGTDFRTRSYRWSEDDYTGNMDVSARFGDAVELFNSGQFYACHDALEEIWQQSEEPQRGVVHGLLQCAVGMHHLLTQNHKGAMMEFGEGLNKLRRYTTNALHHPPSLPASSSSSPPLSAPTPPSASPASWLHSFEAEAGAVLQFIYSTQLEHAACSEDMCVTMDGSPHSYHLLGNFAAGEPLYRIAEVAPRLEEEDASWTREKSYAEGGAGGSTADLTEGAAESPDWITAGSSGPEASCGHARQPGARGSRVIEFVSGRGGSSGIPQVAGSAYDIQLVAVPWLDPHSAQLHDLPW